MKTKYVLQRKNIFKKGLEINLHDSYDVKKKDKESIGIIRFYDKKLIVRVIKRKFDDRFKKILELMLKMDEESDDGSGYLLLLDEADKFRKEMQNKYQRFLKKEQLEFLSKKIELLEQEMKNKLIQIELFKYSLSNREDLDELEDERKRRR